MRLLKISFKVTNTNLAPSIYKLTNRQLFVVNGPDSYKFLQGLITNDIDKFQRQQSLLSLYTLFLNPKGRIITDAIITKPRIYHEGKPKIKNDQLWIQINSNLSHNFVNHLQKYTWKKKIQINQFDGLTLYAGYSPFMKNLEKQLAGTADILVQLSGNQGDYACSVIYDPRGSNIGVRIFGTKQGIEIDENFREGTQQQYERQMEMLGLFPTELMQDKLPFQFNIDFLNGISFNKGCYLGQQVVSRAYFSGIIRRRIFPYLLNNQDKLDLELPLITADGKQLGKVIKSSKGRGIALVNYLDFIQQKWPISIVSPTKGYLYCPFNKKLKQYQEEMKKKKQSFDILNL